MSRPHQLLFVCTGNICRSPIAEYIARAHGSRTNIEVEVRSAGTLGLVGRPADPKMIKVGAQIGLDLSPHVCQPVSRELVEWADHVLVMELAHAAKIQEQWPEAAPKIKLLGQYDGVQEISDPIGSWFLFSFRKSRDQIQRCVHKFLDSLPSEREEP